MSGLINFSDGDVIDVNGTFNAEGVQFDLTALTTTATDDLVLVSDTNDSAALKKVTDPEHQDAKDAMHERIREASALLVARSAELMEVAAQQAA